MLQESIVPAIVVKFRVNTNFIYFFTKIPSLSERIKRMREDDVFDGGNPDEAIVEILVRPSKSSIVDQLAHVIEFEPQARG